MVDGRVSTAAFSPERRESAWSCALSEESCGGRNAGGLGGFGGELNRLGIFFLLVLLLKSHV